MRHFSATPVAVGVVEEVELAVYVTVTVEQADGVTRSLAVVLKDVVIGSTVAALELVALVLEGAMLEALAVVLLALEAEMEVLEVFSS